jgi:hypothetical protein
VSLCFDLSLHESFFVDFAVSIDMAANRLASANQHHGPLPSNIDFSRSLCRIMELQFYFCLWFVTVYIFAVCVCLHVAVLGPRRFITKNPSIFLSWVLSAANLMLHRRQLPPFTSLRVSEQPQNCKEQQ